MIIQESGPLCKEGIYAILLTDSSLVFSSHRLSFCFSEQCGGLIVKCRGGRRKNSAQALNYILRL
ncbi:hypothetical protein HMPREF1986_01632 [Oribacterium sp. oral taxon 078 str. F0263]|nr:hypothetical protein HMPREF1986_01632 [Oribacterium sp. oral taxon 078 str. F0263]